MKAVNGRNLLLTSFLGFCIVLPFAYFHNFKEDKTAKQRSLHLREAIIEAEEGEISLMNASDAVGGFRIATGKAAPSGRIFGGTCFFEIPEIDLFLMNKLKTVEKVPELFPPLDLECEHGSNGIELRWSHNPRNDALIKNLAVNPLLTLRYKIYRWTSGESSRPDVIATLPEIRDQYLDQGIGPIGIQYYYSVLSALEGTVGKNRTLIESERSKVRSILCKDRFTLKLLHGTPDEVDLEISVQKNGARYSRIFSVRPGEKIGGEREVSEAGMVDFSTELKLLTIRTREEEREETILHPRFNSDGSRSIDITTGQPLFKERPEIRTYTIISIECEDPFGRTRIIEED